MSIRIANPYFAHTYTREFVKHMEDIVLEYTSIAGVKIVYVPRVWKDIDNILNEIVYSEFADAYTMYALVEDAGGLETENFILEKFGLAYEDAMLINLAVPKILFKSVVGAEGELKNFAEGDLVYIPKLKLFCEIVSAGTKNRAFLDDANTLMLDIVVKPWADGQYIFKDILDVFDNMEGHNDLRSLVNDSKNLGRIIPNVSSDCILVSDTSVLATTDMPMTPVSIPMASSEHFLVSDVNILVSQDGRTDMQDGIDSLRKRTDRYSKFAKNDKIEEEVNEFVEILKQSGFE